MKLTLLVSHVAEMLLPDNGSWKYFIPYCYTIGATPWVFPYAKESKGISSSQMSVQHKLVTEICNSSLCVILPVRTKVFFSPTAELSNIFEWYRKHVYLDSNLMSTILDLLHNKLFLFSGALGKKIRVPAGSWSCEILLPNKDRKFGIIASILEQLSWDCCWADVRLVLTKLKQKQKQKVVS